MDLERIEKKKGRMKGREDAEVADRIAQVLRDLLGVRKKVLKGKRVGWEDVGIRVRGKRVGGPRNMVVGKVFFLTSGSRQGRQ